MIQLIASVDPSQFLKCTEKLNNIMVSCQNRPRVGLSLLWGIGQAGTFDFQVGFQGIFFIHFLRDYLLTKVLQYPFVYFSLEKFHVANDRNEALL